MDRPDPKRYRKPSESSGARLRSAGGLDRIALRPARDASMRMPASRHGHPHRCVFRQCRHRLRRRHCTRRQCHTVVGHVTRQSRMRCASANGSESESSRHAIVCQSAGSGRTAVKPYFIHSFRPMCNRLPIGMRLHIRTNRPIRIACARSAQDRPAQHDCPGRLRHTRLVRASATDRRATHPPASAETRRGDSGHRLRSASPSGKMIL